MNHLNEEQLILYHYGEGDVRQEVSDHLDTCSACRAEYQTLRQTLALVAMAPVPERSESYGTDTWRTLRPQLCKPSKQATSRFNWEDLGARFFSFHPPRWAVAGGLALLILSAFVAGRFWHQRTDSSSEILVTQSTAPVTPEARERVLLREIGDHLERSQMALIELINSKTNGVVDISLEQALAEQLVGVNRLYRQAAERVGNTGMANVLEDLERTLIEIANSPSRLSSTEFAEFRRRVDTDDMLFKIKVVGSQVRLKEQESARALAGTHS